MTVRYTKAQVDEALSIARRRPRYFMSLAQRFCSDETKKLVVPSMQAWGILDGYGKVVNTNHGTSGRREDYKRYDFDREDW